MLAPPRIKDRVRPGWGATNLLTMARLIMDVEGASLHRLGFQAFCELDISDTSRDLPLGAHILGHLPLRLRFTNRRLRLPEIDS